LLKIPASPQTLYRGVNKGLSQLGQKFEKGKPVVWWPISSTTTHVSVLETFMGKSGDRCMFTIKAHSSRDIQRYSAMGSSEREYVLPPGCCLVVEDILDAGSGLMIVQLSEDMTMKLLKFTPPSAAAAAVAGGGAALIRAPSKKVRAPPIAINSRHLLPSLHPLTPPLQAPATHSISGNSSPASSFAHGKPVVRTPHAEFLPSTRILNLATGVNCCHRLRIAVHSVAAGGRGACFLGTTCGFSFS
jgi:hypothetical protein